MGISLTAKKSPFKLIPSPFPEIYKPENAVSISPPGRNERDLLSTEISGKESPRSIFTRPRALTKCQEGKEKKSKKPNPGSSLSARFSLHSWEPRASQTQTEAEAGRCPEASCARGHRAGGEERRCKQQQMQTVTHGTQQTNGDVTAFAIKIQTKMTIPQEEGWRWWEGARGLHHVHLCCCCNAPNGSCRQEQREGRKYLWDSSNL